MVFKILFYRLFEEEVDSPCEFGTLDFQSDRLIFIDDEVEYFPDDEDIDRIIAGSCPI